MGDCYEWQEVISGAWKNWVCFIKIVPSRMLIGLILEGLLLDLRCQYFCHHIDMAGKCTFWYL
jgi:hypothetical protein